MAAASAEGLRSEPLRAALQTALAGRPGPLEDLLARYGGGPDLRPNVRLAAAFAAELASLPPAAVTKLLARLGAHDAAPDTAQVFLPVAAAFGWVALLRAGGDVPAAWDALGALAADERGPVRVGTLEALESYATAGGRGAAGELVARALAWLEIEDREERWAAAALAVEVLGRRQVLAALDDDQALLDYLSRVVDEVAAAPRSAERSDGRRRLLMSMPRSFAGVVARFGGGDRGAAWLESECARARHPDVRAALSDAILQVHGSARGAGAATADRLRRALQGSAKPPRDPTRIRPGQGRGKASRRTR